MRAEVKAGALQIAAQVRLLGAAACQQHFRVSLQSLGQGGNQGNIRAAQPRFP